MDLHEKKNKLKEVLKGCGKMLIAYSGGVDSTFLVAVAVEALGPENVLACIDKGPSLPAEQYNRAIRLAKGIGVEVVTIHTDEMSDTDFV